jgi:predicted GIY-YIG superfamily endonuclease
LNTEVGPFWVYVLENALGRFYVGQTNKLRRLLDQHNEPPAANAKYTLKNGPWELVWSESHATRASAMRREREIKGMKSAR